MIKSKTRKSYYGARAYADGVVGRIREHKVIEDAYGYSETFKIQFGKEDFLTTETKPVVIEKLGFTVKMGVVTAIARVDGRIHTGIAVCRPNEADGFDIHLGKQLALARALKDEETEEETLSDISVIFDEDDEDFDEDDFDEDEDEDFEEDDQTDEVAE